MQAFENIRAVFFATLASGHSGAKVGGLPPGVETPVTPDEPDLLDGGYVVQGYGVAGLATGTSSASGCLVVFWGIAAC